MFQIFTQNELENLKVEKADDATLIHLFHTNYYSIDDHLRALCANELLRRGYKW